MALSHREASVMGPMRTIPGWPPQFLRAITSITHDYGLGKNLVLSSISQPFVKIQGLIH